MHPENLVRFEKDSDKLDANRGVLADWGKTGILVTSTTKETMLEPERKLRRYNRELHIQASVTSEMKFLLRGSREGKSGPKHER